MRTNAGRSSNQLLGKSFSGFSMSSLSPVFFLSSNESRSERIRSLRETESLYGSPNSRGENTWLPVAARDLWSFSSHVLFINATTTVHQLERRRSISWLTVPIQHRKLQQYCGNIAMLLQCYNNINNIAAIFCVVWAQTTCYIVAILRQYCCNIAAMCGLCCTGLLDVRSKRFDENCNLFLF